jgi:hypothetical protein
LPAASPTCPARLGSEFRFRQRLERRAVASGVNVTTNSTNKGTRMNKSGFASLTLAVAVSLATMGVARAATTTVMPGEGTLQAAINAAASEDVLELIDGVYSGVATVSGKHLTIRAQSAAQNPVLTSSLSMNSDHRFVVQGLQFVDTAVTAAGRLAMLQNTFTRSRLSANGSACHIIGNTIDPQATATAGLACTASTEVVFAGNNFVSPIVDQIQLSASANGAFHIIGNSFLLRLTSGTSVHVGGGGKGTILGNRFSARFHGGSLDGVFEAGILNVGSDAATIRNNAFMVQDASAVQTGSTGYRVSGLVGITVASFTSNGNKVHNNVFDYRNADFGLAGSDSIGAIHASNPLEVSGNVFMRMDQPAFSSSASMVHSITDNLCFQVAGSCPGTGTVLSDPLMLNPDAGDYRLGSGSPAINAGPVSVFLQDIDGSRNDIGIHGGPFDIAQFDVQRGASNAPFVYPLFDANRAVDANGNLQIRLFGAARHQ